MNSKFLLLPSFLAAALGLTGARLAAQTTFNFDRRNFGQNVTNQDGSVYQYPNNNLWTQPYTTQEDSQGNTYPTALTNWDHDMSYPDGSTVTAVITAQTDPNGNTSLNGCHLNQSVSVQNLQLIGAGASLLVDSANNGGGGGANVNFQFVGSGSGCQIINSGLIEVNDVSVYTTTLTAVGALSISGSGTLSLGYGATIAGPATITQASSHTIEGGGGSTITAPFINGGVITANDYGDSTDGSVLYSSLTLSGAVRNSGTLTSTGNGLLYLGGNAVDNTNGTISTTSVANKSYQQFYGVELENGTAITGGSLSSTGAVSSGAGFFLVYDATINGVSLTAGTNIVVDDALNVAGTITGAGTITVNGYYNGGPCTLNASGNGLLSGASVNLVGGGTITVPGGVTFGQSGGGTIQGCGTISGAGTFTNGGAITANAGSSNGNLLVLYFEPTAATNTGTISVTNGSGLVFSGVSLNNTGGTISCGDTSSTLYLQGGTAITGGTLTSASSNTAPYNGVISIEGGTTLTNVTLGANSGLRADYPLAIAGTITNNGVMTIFGFSFSLDVDADIRIAANTTINGTGLVNLSGGTIDATNSAVLTNGAGHTISGSGTINASTINKGTVAGYVSISSPSFTNDGLLEATDNTTLTQNTSSTLTNYNAKTQTLTGGTYQAISTGDNTVLSLNIGSVVTNAASVIYDGVDAFIYTVNTNTDPFAAMSNNQGSFSLLAQRQFVTAGALSNSGQITLDAGATLHVSGKFASQPGSTLAVTIGGTQSQGVQSPGVLQVNGTATLGGTLALSLGAGVQIPAGDTITIMAATGGLTGAFANVPNGERVQMADGSGSFQVNYGPDSAFSTGSVVLSGFVASGVVAHPAFFTGEVALSNGVYYLSFATGNYFGYYSYLTNPHYIYHFDLGYEYWFDAADGDDGVYFYDFKSSDFFYTSPRFPFPYLYDFGLKSVLYYYPDPNSPGRYNTNGIRYFYDFSTGKIIVK